MSPSHKRRLAGTVPGAAAGAHGGRACDSCLRLDARWYCASDDAFLCDKCDASVHAANSLARRHHRLTLKTSATIETIPSWHKGFKRKPRTPRPRHHIAQPHVPELESCSADETESQLIYHVPVFETKTEIYSHLIEEFKPTTHPQAAAAATNTPFTEMDLAEFAADMESLLAPELDSESFCMEELGLMESSETAATGEDCLGHAVKVEMECTEIETLDFNFDCESPAITGEEYEGKPERVVGLRLNYEAVIAEWSMHGLSAWTDGTEMFGSSWMGGGVWNGGGVEVDGGREARVSRYREKRRTRLFAKKIRYEVRKANAEKRPRMKGRFVKRPEGQTSLQA